MSFLGNYLGFKNEPDVSPPTITIISPSAGTTIGAGTPITFQYSDNYGFRRVMPCVKIQQPDGTMKYELIFDGQNFTPDYLGTFQVVQVFPPIWRFTVTRKGGWAAPIIYSGVAPGQQLQLVPFGVDVGGNEPS